MKYHRVRTGLDILFERDLSWTEERRIAFVANHTSVTRSLKHLRELFLSSKRGEIVCIFSPEHGFYGVVQDMAPVGSIALKMEGRSSRVPVISLYGNRKGSLRPGAKHLKNIDFLIYDIQDIGARYYTYISTMTFCMEACAEHGIAMIVLDRPNPINGLTVEGPILDGRFSSFVGRFPVPVRHGMTSGELALLFNSEYGIHCLLDVVRMKGWKRDMWFDDTGLPWIPPSPNIPTLGSAMVYPGTCLIEGTNLSEGRGTTKPFEYIGAPWIEPELFARTLNDQMLPGALFRPAFFKPAFHKYRNEVCGGVHLLVSDRDEFKSFLAGVAIVRAACRLYPGKFKWRTERYEFVQDRLAFDLLAGSDRLRRQLQSDMSLSKIESSWRSGLDEFKRVRRKYLLY